MTPSPHLETASSPRVRTFIQQPFRLSASVALKPTSSIYTRPDSSIRPLHLKYFRQPYVNSASSLPETAGVVADSHLRTIGIRSSPRRVALVLPRRFLRCITRLACISSSVLSPFSARCQINIILTPRHEASSRLQRARSKATTSSLTTNFFSRRTPLRFPPFRLPARNTVLAQLMGSEIPFASIPQGDHDESYQNLP